MDLVDWDLAARIGRRVAPGGPEATPEVASGVVAELQELAAAAVGHVAAVAQLSAPVDDNTAVVDRDRWIDSNTAGLSVVVQPLGESLAAKAGNSTAQLAAAKLTAVQLGAALGWISGKVLGQYEVFVGPGQRPRLLLVAPNIVAAERSLNVPPRDFRLWVCLHEEAHRVQFGSSDWLGDHFAAEVNTFLMAAATGTVDALKRLGLISKTLVQVLRGDPEASLVTAAQNEIQQAVFERLSALMSLLEGHAEWVMDAVGPGVIASLEVIRERFDRRRTETGQADGLLRRLLGMDVKLRQYTHGRAFVSEVVDRVGVAGFNRVWESPQTLPTMVEIGAPERWVARVHGIAA